MNDTLDKQIEDLTQEAASIRSLREKFMVLAETGDRAALAHVRALEAGVEQTIIRAYRSFRRQLVADASLRCTAAWSWRRAVKR